MISNTTDAVRDMKLESFGIKDLYLDQAQDVRCQWAISDEDEADEAGIVRQGVIKAQGTLIRRRRVVSFGNETVI